MLHCPADNITDALRTSSGCVPRLRHEPSLPALSYGANGVLILSWLRKDGKFQTAASIPRPSHTLLIGDSTEPWVFSFCPETHRGLRWSHVACANGPPECKGGYHGGHSGAGHERHTAGSNLAYADGHVAYMPADRFLCRIKGRVIVERPIIWPEAVSPDEP